MMVWYMPLIIALVALIFLFMTGMPIFLGFLVVIVGGVFWLMGPAGFGMVVNSMYDTATTASLGTIPLFILLGEILFRSGCVQVLMESIDKLVGRMRGRQYVLSITLSTVLGALSGSAMAVAAMMGRSLLPLMRDKGYDTRLSIGTILGGACLAPIIPPSLLAIIIGTLADVSISSLLMGGVGPGLFLAAVFIVASLIRVRLNPALAPDEDDRVRISGAEKLRAIAGLLPFSLIIFMVIGLIMLGIATPSESAATGVLGGLITAAWYRRLSLAMLFESFSEAAKLAAVIMLILASAVMFTQLLAFTGSLGGLTRLVTSLEVNRWVMLFMLLALPFVLCMFIDQMGLMLILIPIYVPIIKVMDYDPIWFWVLFLINITLGAITPPFGYVMFALKAAAPDISMRDVFRASWMFVGLTLFGMAVIVALPQIVTFLPDQFR